MDGVPVPGKQLRAEGGGVPEDALLEILSRLPVGALHRAKCVATGWRRLIADPHNRRRLPQPLHGFLVLHPEVYGSLHRGGEHGEPGRFLNLQPPPPLQLDPCLRFLTARPETKVLSLTDSCNGLLLFQHRLRRHARLLELIVCNPATERWVAVPACLHDHRPSIVPETYLLFDPAVSPHFHLLHFWHPAQEGEEEQEEEEEDSPITWASAYSSESGTWSHPDTTWGDRQLEEWRLRGQHTMDHAFVRGMLYFLLRRAASDDLMVDDLIVAIDLQARTQRTMAAPAPATMFDRLPLSYGSICQSQGHLHYILDDIEHEQVSVWVLKEEWILKHTVSTVVLFGSELTINLFGIKHPKHTFLTMHPDRNVLFFIREQKLVSYAMDTQPVTTCTQSLPDGDIVPYVPCFRELSALTAKT
ncbi:hypothetical protein ACP4OV_016703 [Aristida adscensionis]